MRSETCNGTKIGLEARGTKAAKLLRARESSAKALYGVSSLTFRWPHLDNGSRKRHEELRSQHLGCPMLSSQGLIPRISSHHFIPGRTSHLRHRQTLSSLGSSQRSCQLGGLTTYCHNAERGVPLDHEGVSALTSCGKERADLVTSMHEGTWSLPGRHAHIIVRCFSHGMRSKRHTSNE